MLRGRFCFLQGVCYRDRDRGKNTGGFPSRPSCLLESLGKGHVFCLFVLMSLQAFDRVLC